MENVLIYEGTAWKSKQNDFDTNKIKISYDLSVFPDTNRFRLTKSIILFNLILLNGQNHMKQWSR